MQRYAITDRSLFQDAPGGWEQALVRQAEQWAGGGVEWVQLREKSSPPEEIARLAGRLREALQGGTPATRLLINGLHPLQARELGADGVHLPGGAPLATLEQARVSGFVSVSCHSLDEVARARAGRASAILWAPVFGKVVAGEEVLAGTGLERLGEACALAGEVPVFALGGVTPENAACCIDAGAAGVAGIRLFAGEHWRQL